MLSNDQLQHFRMILEDEQMDLQKRIKQNDDLGLNAGHYHESMGELSSYDNHPGDEGTELYEREKDIALNEHYSLQLANINRALGAIDQGTYGKCEVCAKEIPIERLEALPTTTYCIDHSPDKVTSHNRPIEEDVLMPPFGQFDMDEKHETVAFDAEDTWQEVESWGNSETPSDFVTSAENYGETYIDRDENIGYVEDFENFVGVDIDGKNITIYPNKQHEKYEDELDEAGIMSPFGDLPAFEKNPYVGE